MTGLKLFLLGSPRIEHNGQAVHLDRRKAMALIAYLAMTKQSHSRETLAVLLWPELNQVRARAALRAVLVTLNKNLGPACLEVDRESIGLADEALWVDVDAFRALLERTDPLEYGCIQS